MDDKNPSQSLPLANPNLSWAEIFVDELARGGLRDVCIAPGSRSTPLTLAFWAHPQVNVTRHLDERSAGFFALGLALATERPVALVCTSGTAGVNFHPAIVEAQMSQVPLLVLTGDRPFELRHSGANQTIDQVKMFGDHVLWSVDVALPEDDPPPAALRNLRTLAARSLAKATGLIKGPVHLNFPFRPPFEPADQAAWLAAVNSRQGGAIERPFTEIERGSLQPTAKQLAWLAELIQAHPRGLIICGPRCPGGEFPANAGKLAKTAGYPIMADALSGLRYGFEPTETVVLGSYETFLQGDLPPWTQPELIIRFGSVPTSKWLNSFLRDSNPLEHIHIRENGVWADDNHRTRVFLEVNENALCKKLAEMVNRPVDSGWIGRWRQLEKTTNQAIEEALAGARFDGALVHDLTAALPPGSSLMAGNSLPIRHIDQFGSPRTAPLRVFANRGASGIDGNIATGLGVAAGSEGKVVILVGDITFAHDSNSLELINHLDLDQVTIILLNNNGGGIFRRLPIAGIEPPFQELFLTPHAVDFAQIAGAYGLPHHIIQDRAFFKRVLASQLSGDSAAIIEVRSNGEQDERIRREIMGQVLAKINHELNDQPIVDHQ